MILSMTGYGQGSASEDGREVSVELKSVNHRYLDIGMRLPRHISFLEDIFRNEIRQRLSRGHIDIFVSYRNTRLDSKTILLDEALLSQYLLAGRKAATAFGLENDLTLSNALRFPGIVDVSEAKEDKEAVIALARAATQMALDELIVMRKNEGERMLNDLLLHIGIVESLSKEIEKRAPEVVEEYRAKLNERIAQLLAETEIDQARLSTEIALFADRAGIDEEIVRLNSHVLAFHEALHTGDAVGRRLDFIVQEINREFNTIGSKANDAGLVNMVLSGKGEVEKLREQVQNIE